MTNKSLDSRTAEEIQADAELATMVKLSTPSWENRRKELESDLASASKDGQVAKWLRKEIGRCDRALMELGSGRLPEFPCP